MYENTGDFFAMMLSTLVMSAVAAAQGPAAYSSGSQNSAAAVIGTPPEHAVLFLSLVVGGIIAAGGVVMIGRNVLEVQKGNAPSSLIRSWIAISLVLGLILFCAATLLGTNSSLQSILFGGLVASTGTAVAFYFSTQQANQARADILNAAGIGQGAAKPTKFSSQAPPEGKVSTEYTHRFIADGTPAPTYGVTSGELPPGLSLTPDGTLSGKPTRVGPFVFKVTAVNSAGSFTSHDVTITITA